MNGKTTDGVKQKSIVSELSLLVGTCNGIFTYGLASIFIVAIAATVFNAAGAVALLHIRMLVIAFVACVLDGFEASAVLHWTTLVCR